MAEMLSCRAVFEKLQDYLDRELTEAEIEQVRMHLNVCGVCAEEYKFEESVLKHVRSCLMESQVPSNLMTRISSILDDQSEA